VRGVVAAMEVRTPLNTKGHEGHEERRRRAKRTRKATAKKEKRLMTIGGPRIEEKDLLRVLRDLRVERWN